MKPLGLTVTAGAKLLGVTRQTLTNLVNEKAAVSPEMAIRLEQAFGSSAEFWLRLQIAFDVAMARQRLKSLKVKRYGQQSRPAA